MKELFAQGSTGYGMSEPPAGVRHETATIMFTDLVGSTEMFARLGDDVANAVRRAHMHLVRRVTDDHGGRTIKGLGDGMMLVFQSNEAAAAAAVQIQRSTSMMPLTPDGRPVSVRIGVHRGKVINENQDYFGMTVVVASRLCSLAGAGEVLMSEPVAVAARVLGAVKNAGPVLLRGLTHPLSVFALRALDVRTSAGQGADGAPADNSERPYLMAV